MTGHSHTDETGKKFALEVMQKLNDKCAEWREAENIGYSLYGSPNHSWVA
jgi:ribonucleoside-triphosphate reductase